MEKTDNREAAIDIIATFLVDGGGFQKLVDAYGCHRTPTIIACETLAKIVLDKMFQPGDDTKVFETVGWFSGDSLEALDTLGEIVKMCRAYKSGESLPPANCPKAFPLHLMLYAALIAQNVWAEKYAQTLFDNQPYQFYCSGWSGNPRDITLGIVKKSLYTNHCTAGERGSPIDKDLHKEALLVVKYLTEMVQDHLERQARNKRPRKYY